MSRLPEDLPALTSDQPASARSPQHVGARRRARALGGGAAAVALLTAGAALVLQTGPTPSERLAPAGAAAVPAPGLGAPDSAPDARCESTAPRPGGARSDRPVDLRIAVNCTRLRAGEELLIGYRVDAVDGYTGLSARAIDGDVQSLALVADCVGEDPDDEERPDTRTGLLAYRFDRAGQHRVRLAAAHACTSREGTDSAEVVVDVEPASRPATAACTSTPARSASAGDRPVRSPPRSAAHRSLPAKTCWSTTGSRRKAGCPASAQSSWTGIGSSATPTRSAEPWTSAPARRSGTTGSCATASRSPASTTCSSNHSTPAGRRAGHDWTSPAR